MRVINVIGTHGPSESWAVGSRRVADFVFQGVEYANVPYVVMGTTTREEWLRDMREHDMVPTSDQLMLSQRADARFYRIHTD